MENNFIFRLSPLSRLPRPRAGLIALSWNVDTKLKPISGFLRHGRKLHLPDQIYFSPLASINEAPSRRAFEWGAQIEFRCNNVAIEMVRNGKWPFGNQASRKLDLPICEIAKNSFELDSRVGRRCRVDFL